MIIIDVNGFYSFGDLFLVDYIVEFVVFVGYMVSLVNQGGVEVVDSDVDVIMGQFVVVIIIVGEINNDIDVGYYSIFGVVVSVIDVDCYSNVIGEIDIIVMVGLVFYIFNW